MSVEGKVVLITGGNSGIGRLIVHRFVDEGARVAFVGRNRPRGAAVEEDIERRKGEGTFFAVDLTIEEDVAALINDVSRQFGGIDIVVNNAGEDGEPEEGSPPGTRWERMRRPNLDSAYYVASYALPLLKRSGKGAIVNISSTGALHGNWGLFCVAKAGMEGLTRSLAAEGAPYGIRANCVSPGWIATEHDATRHPSGSSSGKWENPPSLLGRMGTPEEIASAVLFLASEEASFITGQTLIVDGGLSIIDYPSLPLLKEIGPNYFSGQL
jgi:NAD(P)-dependent dehydrogenase (short-subunit alcohol dehydrogenase family)